MDEVIYEGFKGTGNSELLEKMWILRKLLSNMDEITAIEEFFMSMKSGAK